MKENIIKSKTMNFALRIVNLYKFLQEKKEFVMSKQLLRSGTSIGALVRESEHAESKMDFIHKLAIAQKEGWKEKFLEEITKRYGFGNVIHAENPNYRLIGLPFFNKDHNINFKNDYDVITNFTMTP